MQRLIARIKHWLGIQSPSGCTRRLCQLADNCPSTRQ